MKFNSINGSGEEFVHLRIPNTVQDTDKYLNVKFAVQMKPESPDSRLLYYGDETVSWEGIRMKCFKLEASNWEWLEPINSNFLFIRRVGIEFWFIHFIIKSLKNENNNKSYLIIQ